MESLSHIVKDMAPEMRHGFETVLGQPLQDNQLIYVVVVTPGVEPSDQQRAESLGDLEQLSKKGSEHRQSLGVSIEEADQTLAEALERERPRKDRR